MFTRKPDGSAAADTGKTPNGRPPQLPNARPAQQPQPRRATGVASIIGADLSITGNLESTGEVQIDGELQGDVHAGRIVVGEQAMITGALIANEIVIGGNVQGSIRGNNVTFQAASRIEGDVFHKTLTIEQGAYFEGKSRRSNDPMSVPQNRNGMVTPN
jgi:cytoskeletal protein CcmA (bactofilin family)